MARYSRKRRGRPGYNGRATGSRQRGFTMTNVYLTGIQLSEFRAFEQLQIDIAAEPGVLIVHGSNGLGKSSLLDALEWTLTGDIDHFTSVDGYEKFGNYLCRWGNRS